MYRSGGKKRTNPVAIGFAFFSILLLVIITARQLFWHPYSPPQPRPVVGKSAGSLSAHSEESDNASEQEGTPKPPAPQSFLDRVNEVDDSLDNYGEEDDRNAARGAAGSTNCSRVAGVMGSRLKEVSFHPSTIVRRRLFGRLPKSLIDQLAAYRTRVMKKLEGKNAQLWRRYFDAASWSPESCLKDTPECSVFLRPDVQQKEDDLFEQALQAKVSQRASEGFKALERSILSSVNSSTDNFLFRKCCFEHRELRRALEYVVFKLGPKLKIKPWLTAGTLLGAFREGGVLIPWDTDVDILINEEDARKVKEYLAVQSKRNVHCKGMQVTDDPDHEDAWVPSVKLLDKDHTHGKLLGLVYGTRCYVHEDASRVEIWVRQETKKMQKEAINLPPQACSMYGTPLLCPKSPQAVLEAGYGEHWCVPCKHKTSSCKGVFSG